MKPFLHPTGEIIVPLADGRFLRSGWHDYADPAHDTLRFGDYIALDAADGTQTLYLDSADMAVDITHLRTALNGLFDELLAGD